MTEDQNQLRTGNMTAEFHAAKNVFIHKVSCHSCNKDVAYASVKHIFNGNAAIETRKHHCFGKLTGVSLADASRMIPCCQVILHKPLIAFE